VLPGALLSAGCFRLLCLHAVAFDYIPCNVPSAQLNTPYSLFSPPSASVLQRACRMHGGGGSGGEDGEDEEELPSLPKLPALLRQVSNQFQRNAISADQRHALKVRCLPSIALPLPWPALPQSPGTLFQPPASLFFFSSRAGRPTFQRAPSDGASKALIGRPGELTRWLSGSGGGG